MVAYHIKNDAGRSGHPTHKKHMFSMEPLCADCDRPIPYRDEGELLRLGWNRRADGAWQCAVCLEDEIMGGEKGV